MQRAKLDRLCPGQIIFAADGGGRTGTSGQLAGSAVYLCHHDTVRNAKRRYIAVGSVLVGALHEAGPDRERGVGALQFNVLIIV